MSRSGYSDDGDNWERIKWRGRVASATRGKRGQKMLRELLAALDAMPVKRLGADHFVEGDACALAVLGQARGLDMAELDAIEEDDADLVRDRVAEMLDVAMPLAAEVMFENDDDWGRPQRTPEQRWRHVRDWVAQQIVPTEDECQAEVST